MTKPSDGFGRWLGLAVLALLPILTACSEPPEPEDPRVLPGQYRPPQPDVDPAMRVPLARAKVGQVIYVPVYSHVYYAGGKPYLLEATLSVRNTDSDRTIIVNSVDYYDSSGARVRRFLEAPLSLKPLSSTEFLIESRDTTGGAGANFLVEWVAEAPVSPPIVECLMAGMSGTHGLSFARDGRVIVAKP